MIVALCALVAVIAMLLYRERGFMTERAQERAMFLDAITRAEDRFARERNDWRDERQTLLNQIKPETAQPVIPRDAISPVPVDLNSDEDFWESREDLADRLMKEEVTNGR